jgi:hypothetical protein
MKNKISFLYRHVLPIIALLSTAGVANAGYIVNSCYGYVGTCICYNAPYDYCEYFPTGTYINNSYYGPWGYGGWGWGYGGAYYGGHRFHGGAAGFHGRAAGFHGRSVGFHGGGGRFHGGGGTHHR